MSFAQCKRTKRRVQKLCAFEIYTFDRCRHFWNDLFDIRRFEVYNICIIKIKTLHFIHMYVYTHDEYLFLKPNRLRRTNI